MARFDVAVDVSELKDARWDSWCDHDPVPGIEYGAVQADGWEHWYVTADSAEQAESMASKAIGDYPVEIIRVDQDLVFSVARTAPFTIAVLDAHTLDQTGVREIARDPKRRADEGVGNHRSHADAIAEAEERAARYAGRARVVAEA